MKTSNYKFVLIVMFLGLTIQPLLAQEQIIKDLIESKKNKQYTFYASTLRMVNLTQNPEYNELVSGIEKLIVYSLDSATNANKSYREIASAYTEEGYDEYIMAFGGELNLALLGKEGKKLSEFTGYTSVDNQTYAFYLRGNIPWQKIPSLIQNIKDEEFLELLK